MDDLNVPLPPLSSPSEPSAEGDGADRVPQIDEIDDLRKDLASQGTRLRAFGDQLAALRVRFTEAIGLKPRR